jgi:hypothetical protein
MGSLKFKDSKGCLFNPPARLSANIRAGGGKPRAQGMMANPSDSCSGKGGCDDAGNALFG